MTIFFDDVDRANQSYDGSDDTPEYITTREILHADDTILLGSNAQQRQYYLRNVVECGKNYGLQLNWDKAVLLRIRSQDPNLDDNGKEMPVKDEAIYSGALISADGNCNKEKNRRIAEAIVAYQKIFMLWNHINLARKKIISSMLVFAASY